MRINKELIGNLIILLAEKCAPLYQTKLLKLLYLIDDEAVRDSGIPITWLDYKVWQYGPVDPEVFDLTRNFSEYVSVQTEDNFDGKIASKVIPVKPFDDSQFSDYDLEIIESVLNKYKDKSASELVALTHKAGSPWAIAKNENTLDFSVANISNVSIDMSRIVKDNKEKYDNYKEAQEMAYFRAALK